MKNYFFLLFLVYSTFSISQPCPPFDEIVLCKETTTDVDILNLCTDLILVINTPNNDDIASLVDANTINFITQPYASLPYLKYRLDNDNAIYNLHYSVLGLNSTLGGNDSPINFEINSCPGTVLIDDLNFNCTSCEYNWTLNSNPHNVVFENTFIDGYNSRIIFKNISTQVTNPGNNTLCLKVSKPELPDCYDEYCFSIFIEELTEDPTFEVVGDNNCICPGQDLNFQNTSTYDPAVGSYVWEVVDASGNIIYSAESYNFLYLFENPGNYKVQLTYTLMVGQSECVSPTTEFEVIVKDSDFIEISCPSVVCSGGPQVSYIALGDASCSNYVWAVNGLTTNINENTDGTIKITWAEVTEYTVGSVILESADCDEDYCFPNIIDVPLFPTAAEIIGPQQVCDNETVTYHAPDIPGSFYHWSLVLEEIDGTTTTHTLNSDDSSQDVLFNSYPNGNITISVDIINPYAGCDVTATLEVIYPDIIGDEEICLGEKIFLDYSLPNLGNISYTITNHSGTQVHSGTTLPIDFTPSASGTYDIDFQTGGTSCLNPVEVVVHEVITPGISGEFNICPGETYQYSIPCAENEEATWTITGGSITTDNGCVIDVVWNSGQSTYSIEVYQSLILSNGQPCDGQVEFVEVEVAMPEINIEGPDVVCYDALSSYTANDIGAEEYIWTVSPENMGSIVNGQGTTDVDVQWLYNSSITSATLTVTGMICGMPIDDDLIVTFDDLSLEITQPSTICDDETQTFVIDAVGGSLNSWNSISWTLDGIPYESGNNLNEVVFGFGLGPGIYTIAATVVNPNGCVQIVNDLSTQLEILEVPSPELSYNFECPLENTTDFKVNVVNISNPELATYAWFKNGVVVIGETESSITLTLAEITSPGFILSVNVTLPNGCDASETLNFNTLCPEDPGDPCCSVDMNFNIFDSGFDGCQTAFFKATASNLTGLSDIKWLIYYEYYSLNPVLENTITVSDPFDLEQTNIPLLSGPGLYTILLSAQCGVDDDGNPCYDNVSVDMLLPFEEGFTYSFICDPVTEKHTIRLFDNSEYDDNSQTFINGIMYNWSVTGQPDQSGMGLTQVDFAGLSPGSTVDVELSMSGHGYGPNGCPVLLKIDVPELPNADFSIANDYSCLGQVLTFSSIQDPSELFITDWDFGDGSFSRINPVEKVYSDLLNPNHPNYTVSLTVTDIYGCSASKSNPLTITDNTINGNITYDMMGSCDAMAELTFNEDPGNAFMITDYEWSIGNVGNTKSAMITQSGVYTVTVTDEQGCTEIFTSPDIILDDAFTTDLTVTSNPCGEKTINFSLNPGFEYLIVALEGNSVTSYPTSNEFNDEGTYVVTVYAFNNGPVDQNTDLSTACAYDMVSFDVVPKPEAPMLDIGSMNCNTGSVPISIDDPGQYDLAQVTIIWNGPGVVNAVDVFSIDAFSNGSYSATVIDRATSCLVKSFISLSKGAPDLSGMISGCYETCQEGGLLVEGILTAPISENSGSWSWNLDGTPIPGYSGTSSTPQDLVLGNITFVLDQEYTITFVYTIDGCVFESEPFCITVEDCTQAPCVVFEDGEACGFDPIDCAVSEDDGGPIFFINMEYLIPTGDDFDPPVPGVTLSYCDVEPVLVDNGTLFVSEVEQIGNDQLNMIGSFSVDNPSIWSASNPLAVEVSYCGDDGNIYCVQYQINPVNCPNNPLECNIWYVGPASNPKSNESYLAQYCVNLYNINSDGCQSTLWNIEGEFEDIDGNTSSAYSETIDITGQGTVVTYCFDVEIPVDMDLALVPFLGFTITSNCPDIGCYHNFQRLGTLSSSDNPKPLIGKPFDESENEFTIDIPEASFEGFKEGKLYFGGKTYAISSVDSDIDIIVEHSNNATSKTSFAAIEFTTIDNKNQVQFVEISFRNDHDGTIDLKVYPNPFSDKFTLDYELTENSTIKVIDVLGRTIENSSRIIDKNRMEIGLGSNEGVYFIQIFENNKLVGSEKIFKLR